MPYRQNGPRLERYYLKAPLAPDRGTPYPVVCKLESIPGQTVSVIEEFEQTIVFHGGIYVSVEPIDSHLAIRYSPRFSTYGPGMIFSLIYALRRTWEISNNNLEVELIKLCQVEHSQRC